MNDYSFFILLILNIISITICQLENEDMTKAIGCMTLITQIFKKKEPDPALYSSIMLKCFVTITESQARQALLDLESHKTSLSKKEIDKLMDINSLRDMGPKEIKQKTEDLEKALKNIKKMHEDMLGGKGDLLSDDYYDDDYFGNRETPSSINFFGLIPKGIAGLFNIFNSYLSLFLIFAIVYFGLLMIRKINDSEKKIKKKIKKKEQLEEEIEEESEEDEDEQKKNSKNTKVKKS